MKCPECEKLEFIVEELKIQLEESREEVKRLREIINNIKGENI
ncbi:MAG TPA: hypothetical protein PK151_06885 [Caldisericia bacterium]|nr:hypothetical protein [Caldisericia bacterium]